MAEEVKPTTNENSEDAVKESTTASETEQSQSSDAKSGFENLLRKFSRQNAWVLSEVRRKEAYDKPSVERKKKSEKARRRKKNGRFNRKNKRWFIPPRDM